MLISIIMPVYNEEPTIKQVLKKVLNTKFSHPYELIIVDDGSKDASKQIIENIAKKNKKIRMFSKKNGGKGSAIRLGFKKAKGDVLCIQDADEEYDPKDLSRLIDYLVDNNLQAVYGTRFGQNKGNLRKNQLTYIIHKLGNQFVSLLTTILYGQVITDMETCYKVFTRDTLKKMKYLQSNKFDIEPEMTAKILRSGIRIHEVPISYYSRSFEEGKKLTWRDGFAAIWTLLRFRFAK